jgi:cytidylate kinase
MPVITLSRQLGSGGDEIAASVAERLGLRLVGFELINRAAREAGAPEVALAAIDELGLLGIRPDRAAVRAYREKIFAVVGELADEGNLLLLGRGGQVILAERPGVLHVRVIAPLEHRVAQLAAARGISAEAAAARIEASDRARVDFVRRYYGANLQDPRLYDLILNTAKLNITTAVDVIAAAAQRVAQAEVAAHTGAAAHAGDPAQ